MDSEQMLQAFMTPTQTASRFCVSVALCASLSACQVSTPTDEVLRAGDAQSSPPGADPDACYGRHATPAIVETVTEQVLVQPPQITADGTVSYPAIYRTETRQEIIRERKELWFETLCTEALTPDFISSVQRALAVRGIYSGPVTGKYDRATRRAVRAYQNAEGLDSDVLSLAAARKLGLVEMARPE
ncbi:MAG: hypothetical protein ACJAYH_002063 [Celeribacter sp.]|jgi:hypothetical protein